MKDKDNQQDDSDIILRKDSNVQNIGGTRMIPIYQELAKITGLDFDKEVEIAAIEKKHGIFLGVWLKGPQPNSSDRDTVDDRLEHHNLSGENDEVENP